MSSESFENPEEPRSQPRNIDQFLMEHLKIPTSTVSTSEYSIQVNMDEENSQIENGGDRKKQKKKQYKRKRKEKKKQEQESAKTRLSVIINKIYQGGSSFESCKEQIEQCLNQLVGGEKFHLFLNEAIKIQVKNMQKEIWDFMQNIINQNSFDSNSNDQQFYIQMIQYMYSQFCRLRSTSLEIEKIINMFMCINSNSTQHMNDQYNLDRSTFNFMIETDETIKNLIKLCYRKIFPQHAQQLQYIRELTQMINKNDMDSSYEEDIQVTQKSTSVDDDDQEKLTKKKRKRKIKESEFKCGWQEVKKRLDDMVIIKDKRSSCQIPENWLHGLKKKYQQE